MGIKALNNAKWTEKIKCLGDRSPQELFNGNEDAYEVALILIRVSNVWDDLIDKDNAVANAEVHYSYISILHDLERNGFYQNFRTELFPMITSSILCYLTANQYEDDLDEHGIELAHMLRYAPAQAVCYIIYLVHGFQEATTLYPEVLKGLCSDRFDDYKAEIMSRNPEKKVA
jgi:hypothetical protein